MPLIDEFRKQFPEYASRSDQDIILEVSRTVGAPVEDTARELGVDINEPGFFTTVKRTGGQMVQGLGEVGRDLGFENNPLQRYGDDVVFRNPSGVNSFQDILDKPGLAIREGAGMGVGFLGPQFGLRALGLGAQALGAARGAGLLSDAAQVAGRAAANPYIGGTVTAGLPSLAGIGQTQRQTGEENLLAKYGGATAVGLIEQFGGPQRFLRNTVTEGVLGGVPREALAEMGRTPLRTFGRNALRIGAEEAGEEAVQNPIEQLAGGQSPLAPAQLQDTAFSTVMGGIGGLVPFGLGVGARRAMQQRSATEFANRNLTNVDAATQQRLDAAEIQRGFMAQQVGDSAADQWYQDATNQILVDRQDAIFQALQAGLPFDLLSGDVPGMRQQVTDLQAQAAQAAQAQQGTFQPLPTDQPMMGLPHAAPAMPIGAGTEPPVNRAASIYANLAGKELSPQSQESVDFDWAKGVLQQALGEDGLAKFTADVVSSRQPTQKAAAKSEPKVKPPKLAAAPAQPAAPATYGAMFKVVGGRVTNVVKALDAAKTQEDAVDIVRQWIEKPTIAQSTHNALAELHKQITGETYDQYLQRTEANERAAFNPQAPGPVTVIRPTPEQGQDMAARLQSEAFNPRTLGPVSPQLVQPSAGTNAQQQIVGPTEGAAQPVPAATRVQNENTIPRDPEELMSFLMNEVGKRDKRKQVILEASLGRLDGNAHADPDIAQEMGLSKSTVQSLRKEAEAIFHQLVRKYNIRPEQLQSAEDTNQEEVVDDRSTQVEGTPAEVSSEESAATSEEHGIASLAPSQQEAGGSNTGFRIIDKAGDINSDKASSPEDTQAKQVAKVFERGSIEDEAATVWDAFSHRRTEQGEHVKSWDALAKTERGQQTQRDWVEFYRKSKESPKPDIAQLSRLSKTVKGPYASAGDKYVQLTWREFHRLLAGSEAMGIGDRSPLGLAVVSVWQKFSIDGLSPVLRSRISRMRIATEPLGGDRQLVVAKIPGESGYTILVDPEFIIRAPELSLRRAVDHEFWHILDDAAATGGVFSNNSMWGRFGPISRAIRSYAGEYTRAPSWPQWSGFVHNYPMASKFSTLPEESFHNELFAQIMSAYHSDPSLSGELKKVYPFIYNVAEATYATIREKLAGSVREGSSEEAGDQGSATDQKGPYDSGASRGIPKPSESGRTPLDSAGEKIPVADRLHWINLDIGALSTQLSRLRTELNSASAASRRDTLDAIKYQQGLLDGLLKRRSYIEAQGGAVDGQGGPLASVANVNKYADLGLDSLPSGLREPAVRIKDTLTNWAKKGIQYAAFAHDLADIAVKEGLTKAKNFFDLINTKGATLIHLEAEVDRILTEASNVSDRQAVNNFLRRSTREQKWGYVPSWQPDVTVDSGLASEYSRLSENGKKVVDSVFKYGEDTYQRLSTLINKEINSEFDEQLKAATTEDERKEIESERRRHLRSAGRVMPKLEGPYTPLRRFGNYVVVAKSQAYVSAEKLNDHKTMEEMQDDPRHYRVEFHEHFAEAKARARELEKAFRGGYVEPFERQKSYSRLQELPWSAIKRVKDAVEGLSEKTDYKAALNRVLTDIYLTALSESSARKAELQRRYVPGEDPDMLRAFAYNGRATAHFVASLQHNTEINDILNQMKSEAREGESGTREGRSRVLNEILARYVQGLDRRPTPLADKAMRLTSLWFLVSSPSYYLQNATQPFMLTLPMLNARFGAATSWAALLKSYKDVAGIIARTTGKTLDIDKLPISPDEKNMLSQLRDIGLIDITIAQDLGRWTEGETVLDKGAFGKAMRKLWAAPRHLEMINRITSALAAWRLSEGNYDYTSRIVKQTHGNYAASNAPRVFNANGVAKLMLQFRKFQLIQASLLARLLHDSLRGASPEERLIARHAVAWLMAHHMVLAGALGLPTANLIGYLLAAIGGDDDEPKDVERMLRQVIGDKDIADLLLKGLPAYLGVDVSRRVGMGDTFSVLPFTDINLLDRAGLGETVLGASGAFVGGLLPRWADAAGLVAKGDYYKGLESMMPRALQDSMKALRFAQEGVTQKGNRDVVIQPDELSLFTLMSQVVGLPSKVLTDRQRIQGDLIDVNDYYKERLATMRFQYAKAYRENDTDTMGDMREEWAAVAQAMRRNGFKPQPLSNLLSAPLEQRNRERGTVAGVQSRKGSRGFVQQESQL